MLLKRRNNRVSLTSQNRDSSPCKNKSFSKPLHPCCLPRNKGAGISFFGLSWTLFNNWRKGLNEWNFTSTPLYAWIIRS
jgi:hypothetical protein